jgi:hypothetical protein
MGDPDEPYPVLRRILPFSTAAVVIAALYVGWTFYSRWSGEREAERAAHEREAESAQQTLDLLGGGGLKVLTFYGSPMVIHRGKASTVCYGVTGAKNVHIEPEIEPVKPSLSRCIQAFPRQTTTYTLSADDGAGHGVNQSFVLTVIR